MVIGNDPAGWLVPPQLAALAFGPARQMMARQMAHEADELDLRRAGADDAAITAWTAEVRLTLATTSLGWDRVRVMVKAKHMGLILRGHNGGHGNETHHR